MISGIILAAGESSRMQGFTKALLPLKGETFLELICSAFWQAGIDEVVVVLGADSKKVVDEIVFSCEKAVLNRNYAKGQLSSLRVGLKNVSEEAEAVMVALVDHPLVTAKTYHKLISAWKEDKEKILIPTYQGKKGHPAVFPARLFKELLRETLPEGARTLIMNHADEVKFVEVDDKGIITDIDTQEMYQDILHATLP